MDVSELVTLAQEALLLSVALSLPVVLVAGVVGLLVAALQAATQLSDPTIAHLPRLVVVAIALAVAAPWMGAQLSSFAARSWTHR